MHSIDLYIICGGLFCLAYLAGWLLEQREITKRIEKDRTATIDWILSPSGRALISKFAKVNNQNKNGTAS